MAAEVELIMPKMGESIMEATILKWLKKEGDMIEVDDAVLEIATDKVDSEVPSPVAGRLTKMLFKEGDVVPVGKAVAMIASETAVEGSSSIPAPSTNGKAKEPAREPVAEMAEERSSSGGMDMS